jgi:spore coat protein CotH
MLLRFAIPLSLLLLASRLGAQGFYGPGIQEVRLEFADPGWDQQLDEWKRNKPEARLLATALVNGVRYDSVGARYKGNSSYFKTRKDTLRKLPFNIKLNYGIKGVALPEGQTNLKFSNGFLDPSFVRDPLAYDIVRNYMPAPACNFARLYINNRYWGLYVNTESIDERFIRKHMNSDAGHLVKCDPDNWKKTRSEGSCPKGENASLEYLGDKPACYEAFYEVDDPKAWSGLLQLIKVLNQQPQDIESVLNVDQALWMLALNNALVNFDSYTGSLSHNYYLWFDSLGMAHPLIWDLNMAFGGWRRDLSFRSMTDEQLIQYHPLAESNNPKRPLIQKLLANSLYRKIYLAHMRTIVQDHLQPGVLTEKAKKLQQTIDPWVRQDTLKLYDYEWFQQSLDQTMTTGSTPIIGVAQLMEPRGKWLSELDIIRRKGPAIDHHEARAAGDTVHLRVTAPGALKVYVSYRTPPARHFKRAELAFLGDGAFEINLPRAAFSEYYLIAESPQAVTLHPKRASHAVLRIDPSE